jgi:hypothetical protein
MQGGGQDRAWYEPLRSDGSRDLDTYDETIGCHVGPYAGLNVARPQPGFEYSWAINDPRELLRARQRGAQIVQSDDPEYSVYNEFEDSDRTPLDTAKLYEEVILVRTPLEVVRKRREEEQRRAEASLHGSVRSFTDKASALESDAGRRGGHSSTRFARHDHMVEYDTDGRTEAVWTPDSGIVRR